MKKFLFSIICTLFPIFASAQEVEPYAILIDDGTALEFRYDDMKSAYRDAMDIGPFTEAIQRGWESSAEGIKSVVFNESFANCTTITSTAYWFAGLSNLETFIGLEYLNTSNVTNMYMMFYNCTSLASLDLSYFNTQNVTDMSVMFGSCNALTTIIVGSDWTTDHVEESGAMFESCFNLVGGNGTTFSQMNTDASYAHIDTEDHPGYLTGSSSGDEPYWQELSAAIEHGSEVLVQARESGNVDQWLLEELEMTLENANEMYNKHEADEEEVRNMTDELNARIYKVEEAMKGGGEASEETWERLQSMIDYGSDILSQARESSKVDQWLIEELEMTLDNAHEMYKEHTATEEEVLNMIDELEWRIREVEEAMKGGGEEEPYAVLSEENTVLTFYYDNEKEARGGMDVGPFEMVDGSPNTGWASVGQHITTVVFDSSFANCTTISSTAYWFCSLPNLKEITDLEYLNTSNVTDMRSMFYGCMNLASLDVSNFDTSNVTNMSDMFTGCSSLINIDLNSFNTSNVTDMGSMFDSCSGFISLNLSNFDTSNVTDMSGMFGSCSSLTELDLSNFNTSNVEYMSALFYECSSLTTIYAGENWTTSRVLDGEAGEIMFVGCTSLVGGAGTTYDENHVDYTYAHIDTEGNPGYFTASSSVVELYWEELKEAIDYGSEILVQARESGKVDQWLLEELEMTLERANEMYKIHEADEEEVRNMTEELNERIREVEEAMKGGGEEEPYAVLSEENSVLTFYYDDQKDTRGGMDVGPFEDGGRTSGSGWSEFNEQITTVVFDESFANCTTLTSTAYWFYGCENLTTITDFNNLKTDNVTDINAMFSDCHSLTSIDFSSLNLSNVTNMSQVFEDCRTLESINFRGVNTENVTNMSDLFLNCHNLRTIDLSSFNTRNVTNMSHMFCRCDSLTTIYVGEGWNTENVTESDQMFERSANLVGGLGTTYDENHIGIEYAHIDGGVDNPGYLTGINEREAYFDGLTAWVYGDATLNDAFAAVGREAAVQTVAAIVWEANGELTSEQLEGITNPNLLVYVNEASKAPADVQNVIIDGVAEEIILTDATGNSNFYCPQPFTAKSISYSRDFSQTTELEVSRGWETIALPFDVQSISHESHGNLIPFGGEDDGYHFWLRQLSEQGLERATQIEANKPYLISMPNNTIYPSVYNQNGIVTFSSTDVTVPETNPQSDAYADVTLHAAFQQVEQGSDVYALNVGEARGEYPEGSVFEQNYRDIRPFQAYTTHRAGTRFIPLGSLGGKDGATGINELRVENGEKKENAWYSLDGRRLYVKPTKKGVYVKDGQKIVIK